MSFLGIFSKDFLGMPTIVIPRIFPANCLPNFRQYFLEELVGEIPGGNEGEIFVEIREKSRKKVLTKFQVELL